MKIKTPVVRKKDIIQSKRNIFPIVNYTGELLGIIHSERLFSILLGEEEGASKTFDHLAQKPNDIINESENMEIVMAKMNRDDVWILPVVNDDNKYLGFVSKSSVFNKYRALLIRQGQYLE